MKATPGRGVIGVLKQRFWSFAMVVGIGFLLLVSLAANALLSFVLIVILLWIYYSAQVVFFGAEFTKVYSRRHTTKVH